MLSLSWDDYRQWLSLDSKAVLPNIPAPQATDFHTDSRTIKPGQWFIPLVGENFDGHAYIAEVMQKNAAGFFYEPARATKLDPALLAKGVAVKSTLGALQTVGLHWRRELSRITLAALTGSTGKTTTKNFVGCILQAAGHAYVSQGNYNNEIGVPLNLLQLNHSHKLSVLELGARHPGDIALLVKLVEPQVAACLNVGSSHLGEFGSRENLLKTKTEIFFHSPRAATVVAFHDQPEVLKAAQESGRKLISFGTNPKASVRVLDKTQIKDGMMEFSLSIGGRDTKFQMQSLNAATPINAAAACAIAWGCGIPVATMQKGLANYRPAAGRFRPIKKNHYLLIDDAYNANPESMDAGLESVQQFFPNYEKILILGDMRELGPVSQEGHYNIGQKCSKINGLKALWLVGEESKQIKRGAVDGGLDPKKILHVEKVEDILNRELPLSSLSNPLVYIKASNGTGLHKLVAQLEQGNG